MDTASEVIDSALLSVSAHITGLSRVAKVVCLLQLWNHLSTSCMIKKKPAGILYSTGFSLQRCFEKEEQQSSLSQPPTNADALCDLVVNLNCLTETCMGENYIFRCRSPLCGSNMHNKRSQSLSNEATADPRKGLG